MDRPSKVCIVSEAEDLPSSLGFLREETLMEGQPNHKLSSYIKGGFFVSNYIGIDVSKQSLNLFDGINDYEVPNEKSLKTFKKVLNKAYGKEWKKVLLIYEPTGPYSNYLREFASKYQVRVHEINPKKSANFAKVLGNRSKTDLIDSKMLYRFSILLKEEDFTVPVVDRITEQLSSYLSSYKIIQKTSVMLFNHLYSKEYETNLNPKLENSIKKEFDKFKDLEDELEKEMKLFSENTIELKEDYANLQSIKGIGVISAIALLCLFRKYPDANRSEITALAGLDPIKRESGTSLNGGKRISKAGSGLLRRILYFSCMSSIQHNDRIKIFYEHLLNNHKPKKVALIACMKKMVLIAHQIYVKKEKYKQLIILEDKNYCFIY